MEKISQMWAWLVANKVVVYMFALGAVGAVVNVLTRITTSNRWPEIVERWPRVAASLLMAKAFFSDVLGALKYLPALFTGRLPEAGKGKSVRPPMMPLLVLCAVLFGCSPLAHPRLASSPKGTPEECAAWDDASVGWSSVAAGAAAGAGLGALGTALQDSRDGRVVTAGGTLGVAIVSAVAVTLANRNAARFTERCQ